MSITFPNLAQSVGYKGVLLELPDNMEGETDFLFRNRGDGTFEDVSEKAGVNDPHKLHGMGVVWATTTTTAGPISRDQ